MSSSIEVTSFKGSEKNGIVESTSHRQGPTGNDVLVKITHSGICGTDEHYKHVDMVLGHEGVGIVEQIGDRVTRHKVGDVVGWGYVHKTCGECEQCLIGQDQYCSNNETYGNANFHQGSFGSHAIWDASFVFKIPDGLAPEDAAPLMCGGATVFEIIESYDVRPTHRIGVVGVGGLGHLAVQFLAKMGASVVVFSSTESKRAEAMRLGATEFCVTRDKKSFDVGKLDHLIITTSFMPEWKPFLDVLKPRGTIYPLTVDYSDFVIPMMPLVFSGFNVQGSLVASRIVMQRMLEFAAKNSVKPMIEKFPLTRDGVVEGMTKLREGKMRYRGVLVAA
ncbi:NAD(P)-dependent alcohol dehydrogenase protein [Favolaschia claudopus]|uniref:NAD(P)-dependent alcohol dehydrogenase protein n=1 Tax=Favolaschia claudopus TaxID=2862362 RepID=A0AAW0A9N9_9AGAR